MSLNDQEEPVRHQFSVTVNVNGSSEEGVLLNLISDITYDLFLQICKQKLGIEVKRVFDESGHELKSMEEIQIVDVVWVSQGRNFSKKNLKNNQLHRKSTREENLSFNKISVALLGRGKVGKSSLAQQYTSEDFSEEYEPTMQEKHTKTEVIEGDSIRIEILDTAGEEQYAQLRRQWMANKEALFFVYSVDDLSSFAEIPILYMEVQRIYSKNNELPILCLIGNKMDVENRVITTAQGQKQAQSMGALFYECSASEGSNVLAAFQQTIKQVHRRQIQKYNNRIKKDQPIQQENCCTSQCTIF